MQPLSPESPRRRALVVSLRYLGDALLATPVVEALKQRWPACEIDVLTFRASAAALEGNPSVAHVITVGARPTAGELLRELARLWRRYDLALVAQAGTRPFLYGWAAGRQSVGFVAPALGKSWWKRLLLSRSVVFDPLAPTVVENRRLAAAAGAPGDAVTVTPPASARSTEALIALAGFDLAREPYVVVHPAPRTAPKRWTRDGWRRLFTHLLDRGLHVVISGGPGDDEARYVGELLQGLAHPRLHNLQGRLTIAEVADVIARAQAFVGVDTGTTHVAASTGTPTVAIFGPTDPVIWGPWPRSGGRPYAKVAPLQRRGNVLLIQNAELSCVPCQLEGCERHVNSRSDCLDRLAPARVIEEVDRVLARGIGSAEQPAP